MYIYSRNSARYTHRFLVVVTAQVLPLCMPPGFSLRLYICVCRLIRSFLHFQCVYLYMCLCVYVYMCICVYVYMCVCVYVFMYICMCVN